MATGLTWFSYDAVAACNPVTGVGTPSNTTITCSGVTNNQDSPNGYGTGQQDNNVVNVQAGASVTGTDVGFFLGVGNTINLATGATVSGAINGTTIGTGTTTINNTGGTISGSGNAAFVNGISSTGGTLNVTNTGSITGTSTSATGFAAGINSSGNVTVTNLGGTIRANTTVSGASETVAIQGNNVTIANNTGTIASDGANTTTGAFGILGLNSITVTANTGTISAANQAISAGAGVTSVNVSNNAGGTIRATETISAAINVNSGGATAVTVNNAGTISGVLDGVNTNTTVSSNVTNSGQITGSTRNGIRVNAAAIDNSGTVNGATAIFFRAGNTASSIVNSGTINGTGGTAIQFSTGSVGNMLTLAPSSSISGTVAGIGTDILQLGGTGSGTFNASNIGAGQQYQGFSTFNKIDSSTWTLTGTGDQAWTVQGGTLSANGTIALTSGVTVNSGGTLGGTGTVGSLTVNNGGTLAPGNSIGTLTVSGNLGLASSASYAVEVSPTASDRTNVSGTASLAGAVNATFQAGSYMTRNYTILHTDGGRNGTFSTFTTNGVPANFAAALRYTANDVFLDLTSALGSLNPDGLTRNQQNVASSLNNFFNAGGTFPAGFSALYGFTGTNLGNALNQVSGEAASGAPSAAFQSMNQFLATLGNQFGGAADGAAAASGPARGFAAAAELSPEAATAYAAVTPKDRIDNRFNQRWALWASVGGSNNNVSGDAATGSHNVTARSYNVTAGADYRVSASTMLGFALGGGGTNWGVSDGLGGGHGDVFQLGLHGSHKFGAAYLAATLAYAWHNVSTERTVTVNGSDRLAASFNAQQFGGRFEGGYRYAMPFVNVTPYAALQVQDFYTPAYSENASAGAGTYALSYGSKNTVTTRTELGSQFDKMVAISQQALLTLRGRAAWAHDGNTDRSVSATFQALQGAAFTVNGASAAKDAALLSSGAELRLANNITLGAKFDSELARHARSYAGTGSVRYVW